MLVVVLMCHQRQVYNIRQGAMQERPCWSPQQALRASPPLLDVQELGRQDLTSKGLSRLGFYLDLASRSLAPMVTGRETLFVAAARVQVRARTPARGGRHGRWLRCSTRPPAILRGPGRRTFLFRSKVRLDAADHFVSAREHTRRGQRLVRVRIAGCCFRIPLN